MSGGSYGSTRGSYGKTYDRTYETRAPAPDLRAAQRAREEAEAEERAAAQARDADRQRRASAEADRLRREEKEATAEAARRKSEDDERARKRAESVRAARENVKTAPPPGGTRRETRDTVDLYDHALVRARITRPHPEAQAITILDIDNSGSNREVAQAVRGSSGFILATMGLMLGPRHQLAIRYVSDHCDGLGIRQDVDFVFPNEEGDRVVYSTTRQVRNVSGGDEAEAFECTLHDACDIDFGHVLKPDRHLILATDVVGHGMGMRSDNGCPAGRDWQHSVDRVYETFGSFEVIGTGETRGMAELQRKFLRSERVPYDLLDFSSIAETRHRLGIIPAAAIFLMCRADGPQTAKRFLQFLYHKWLSDPVFGQDTDLRAREAIRRFFKFIEGMDRQMEQEWSEAIFAD